MAKYRKATKAQRTGSEELKVLATKKESKRLIDLLGNIGFVKCNPDMVTMSASKELVSEILDMNLAGNLTPEDINMVSQIIVKAVKGFRSLHNDTADFEGLMSKFCELAGNTDGFLELSQEIFNVIKATYYDEITDDDAGSLTVYICAQACIESVFGVVVVDIAASDSTTVETVEEEQKEKKESKLSNFDPSKFTAKQKKQNLEEEKMKKQEEKVFNSNPDKIAESIARSVFKQVKEVICSKLTWAPNDKVIMELLIKSVEEVISSTFSPDQLETLKESDISKHNAELMYEAVMFRMLYWVATYKLHHPLECAASESTEKTSEYKAMTDDEIRASQQLINPTTEVAVVEQPRESKPEPPKPEPKLCRPLTLSEKMRQADEYAKSCKEAAFGSMMFVCNVK